MAGVWVTAGAPLESGDGWRVWYSWPGGDFTPRTPRFINVSVLKQINAGATLTTGFVIGGSSARTVLIRAVGPTLGAPPFGIAGVMNDPQVRRVADGCIDSLAELPGVVHLLPTRPGPPASESRGG